LELTFLFSKSKVFFLELTFPWINIPDPIHLVDAEEDKLLANTDGSLAIEPKIT